jgi:predicted ATP-grasp superfamily ATP-dependent carboligase
MSNNTLAIVLGLSPTGLYVIRELGKQGVPVLGITDGFECGRSSKFLSHPNRYWQLTNEQELLAKLCSMAELTDTKPVLLPTADRHIDFISRFSDQLKKYFVFQTSYAPNRVSFILDKSKFYALCEQHGLAFPYLWRVQRDLLSTLINDIRFPCIIKPSLIHEVRHFMAGKKVLLAHDRSEYEKVIKPIPESASGWLVQEIIPGPESNIRLFGGYFDLKSLPQQTFTASKLRQYPPGFGSASLVESRWHEEIHTASVDFLKKIGFQGICGTEFKIDPRDNVPKMIEINPRPTLWFHITHTANKRIAYAAYRDLQSLSIPSEVPQKEGILWRYALKDIYSSIFYVMKKRSFIFPPPQVGKKWGQKTQTDSWAVFDKHDPVPTVAELFNYFHKAMQRFW